MGLDAEMRKRLEAALAPTELTIVNESALHAGHAGDDGSGESHWRVVIASREFEGKSRSARHRAVHAALGKELVSEIHALALTIRD